MLMKPTVGRIVHFFTGTPPDKAADGITGPGLNGQGSGPYPAMILQVFGDGQYVNLKVIGWRHEWYEGSVSEGAQVSPGRYWEWPERV